MVQFYLLSIHHCISQSPPINLSNHSDIVSMPQWPLEGKSIVHQGWGYLLNRDILFPFIVVEQNGRAVNLRGKMMEVRAFQKVVFDFAVFWASWGLELHQQHIASLGLFQKDVH